MIIAKDVEDIGRVLRVTYYPSICLQELKKITKNLSQDSRPPVRDLKPGAPEYKAGVLATRPRRSVTKWKILIFTIATVHCYKINQRG
jgi:hypothetical protein